MPYYSSQYRFSLGPRATEAVKNLLIANGVVFVVQMFSEVIFHFHFNFFFGLVPYLVSHKFFVWQFFTYMFLHGGLMHLLYNLLVLWMLGGELETQVFGPRRFYIYYFVCGVGAGVFNFLFSFNSAIPIIGASGAIYGILAAYAIYFGHRKLFIFPFPVSIEARYFVLILGGIELFSSIFYSQSGIAHLAHLGGMIVGYLYIIFWLKRPPRVGNPFSRLRRKKHLSIVVDESGEEREIWH